MDVRALASSLLPHRLHWILCSLCRILYSSRMQSASPLHSLRRDVAIPLTAKDRHLLQHIHQARVKDASPGRLSAHFLHLSKGEVQVNLELWGCHWQVSSGCDVPRAPLEQGHMLVPTGVATPYVMLGVSTLHTQSVERPPSLVGSYRAAVLHKLLLEQFPH